MKKILAAILSMTMFMVMCSFGVMAEETTAEELNEFGVTDTFLEEMCSTIKEKVMKEVFEPNGIDPNEFNWDEQYPDFHPIWIYWFDKNRKDFIPVDISEPDASDLSDFDKLLVDTISNTIIDFYEGDKLKCSEFIMDTMAQVYPEELYSMRGFAVEYISFCNTETEE